ncbi:MAG: hypothetical protein HC822_21495 [Oscillochloris sp.]|nr:hypothetical protein [Oscillochloris sp.]
MNIASGTLTGIFAGVNADGALLLRDSRGQMHTITAGDVGLL